MATYNRTLLLTENELTTVDLAILFPYNNIKVTSSLPAWFIDNKNIFDYSSYWEITPPLDGTYTYNIDVYSQDEPTLFGTGIITIIVKDVVENVDNCCDDNNINIVWINRQGGRGNFIFSQRKDFTVSVGKSNTFITGGIKKYSEIKGVYNGKIVYTTGITQTMVDYLDTLRYGIQAWVFNTDNTFTPILLDIGSYTKYTTKENLYELNISFIYANQLDIQRQ